jgi:uncharacterized protein (UPF0332 family)
VNGANRAANAKDELERSRTCLEEAKTLRAASFTYGAVSRAYYAVFHAARALLFSAGIETKTHRAVASLFGEHFVKSGKIPPDLGRLVSRMQRDREDADYETGAVFTDAEAAEMIHDAESFLSAATKLVGP